MFRAIVVSLLLALPVAVPAEELVLRDIKAQQGVRLSKEELNQLMPNSRVVSYFKTSTRHWTNEPDGTFTAYGDSRGSFKQMQASASGKGEWNVSDKGQYCVSIEWTKKSEKWCRFLFRVGDKYYGVKSLEEEDGNAFEYEIKK